MNYVKLSVQVLPNSPEPHLSTMETWEEDRLHKHSAQRETRTTCTDRRERETRGEAESPGR